MKKYIFLVFMLSGLFAKDLAIPPMPPGMNIVTKTNKKAITKDPCSLIPPMLYHLPTPLLSMVDKCQTNLLKPSKELVKKRLLKNNFPKNITITKISKLKDANRLYKIVINKPWILDILGFQNNITLICDEKIKLCFKDKVTFMNE